MEEESIYKQSSENRETKEIYTPGPTGGIKNFMLAYAVDNNILEPEDLVEETQKTLTSIGMLYGVEALENMEIFTKVYTQENFTPKSKDIPLEERVEQEIADKKVDRSKASIKQNVRAMNYSQEYLAYAPKEIQKKLYNKMQDAGSFVEAVKEIQREGKFSQEDIDGFFGPSVLQYLYTGETPDVMEAEEYKESEVPYVYGKQAVKDYQRQIGMPEGMIDGAIGSKSYPYVVLAEGSPEKADKAIRKAYKNKLLATGKYQFIPMTLEETARKAGIPLDTKYSKEVQDKLAIWKLNDTIKRGKGSAEEAARELANVWASLPKNEENKSAYEKSGNRVSKDNTFERTVALVSDYYKTGDPKPLLEYIAAGESQGSYTAKNAGTAYLSKGYTIVGQGNLKNLTNMTIREILERR
jgi:muramidase (phage lysozyme)